MVYRLGRAPSGDGLLNVARAKGPKGRQRKLWEGIAQGAADPAQRRAKARIKLRHRRELLFPIRFAAFPSSGREPDTSLAFCNANGDGCRSVALVSRKYTSLLINVNRLCCLCNEHARITPVGISVCF